jgi:type II secretory pathway pseudopilin PulG
MGTLGSMKHIARGFMIVELLVVIIIIAILTAISFVMYQGAQDRAKVAAIVAGIKSTEDAMSLALTASRATEWWDDDNYRDVNGEPLLAALIAGTNLKNFMSEVPKVGGTIDDDSFWMYDNDGPESAPGDDDYDPTVCPQSNRSGGVNIQIELHSNRHLAQKIDEALDDGNLACGKFREHHSNEGEFLWLLSSNYRKV